MQLDLNIAAPDLYANRWFNNIITNRDRYLLLYGGRDGGKSYAIAQKIIYNILTEPYCKVVLVRKVFNGIKATQYETLLNVIAAWGLDDCFEAMVSPLEIRCKNGNIIIARGLDDPNKLKSIFNPTIVWVEEADEISYKAFTSIDFSIRAPRGNLSQFIMSFNPSDEDCWINDYFFPSRDTYEKDDGQFYWIKSKIKKTTILHTTFLDNKYVPEERRERQLGYKYIDFKNYKIALMGLWGSVDESIIFPNVNYVNTFPSFEERQKHGLGLDFGFTNDPSCAVEGCIAHGEIFLHELFYKRGLVNYTDIADQPSIDKEFKVHGIRNEMISADSAEPKSIAELKLRGYHVRGVDKAKVRKVEVINMMKSYKINLVNSPNGKKEAKLYKYIVKDDIITNVPMDMYDHFWDAARYWFMRFVIEQEVIFGIA